MVSSPFQPPSFTIAMRGYDAGQVNQLVARIAEAHTQPDLAATVAAEIRSAKFSTVMRGFDVKQVDGYLAQTATTMAGTGQPTNPGPAPTTAVPSVSVRPRGDRFPKRFGSAYRTGDVDAFVERVASTLNTTLTSHETQVVQFGNTLRGYAVDAVDDWIDQVRANLLSRGR